jgi:predicted ATP-grasp superfamily ATP-dependent carboligase
VGFSSRWVHEKIRIPHQGREMDACRRFVLDLLKKRPFEMILPLGDEATQVVAGIREEVLQHTKLVLVPYDTFMIFRNKITTMQAAERAGVPIPKTYTPPQQSFDEIDREVVYPVLVKPAFSNGARGITYAYNKDEMVRYFGEVTAAYGPTFVQEFIPQTGLQYKTELLTDPAGEVLGAFSYAKIRYYPPNGGSSTLNQTVDYPELAEHAIRLARSVGWYGMSDFDWIFDERDGTPKLMEINPRVTDTIRIAQLAGIDFFGMLYDMACGRPVTPVRDYRKGLYMRFLPGELMWFVKTKGPRFGLKPSFFKFFGRNVKYLLLSAEDPGAFLGYLLENFSDMLNARERAFKLRTPTVSAVQTP